MPDLPADAQNAPSLFPVALSIQGRKCVVVGGGAVGERKAAALLECGASVVVLSPELRSPVLAEWERTGRLRWIADPFSPEHLTDAFLCVAATDSPAVNEAVFHAAREQNVLCNLAAPVSASAEPDEIGGDFVTMASVRRGDLLLAVTTGGAGPALSARIKRDWEIGFGPEWEPYTRLLREMRTLVKTHAYDEPARTQALRRLANADGVREKLALGDGDGAHAEALLCL